MIRGIPKHMENYISVHYTQSLELHEKGFQPAYMSGELIYYHKTEELVRYLKSKGEEV